MNAKFFNIYVGFVECGIKQYDFAADSRFPPKRKFRSLNDEISSFESELFTAVLKSGSCRVRVMEVSDTMISQNTGS